jgi:O-antigen ligase
LWGIAPKKWLQQKWWLLGVLWVAFYFISYFWSHNIPYWSTRTQVKLPLLFLPLAFAFMPQFSLKQLHIYTAVLQGLLLTGVAYSLYFFISNPQFYIDGYKVSHVLPTIPENDHIRFSLMVAGGIIWSVFFFPKITHKAFKVFTIITLVLLSIYLHLLAARAGLVAWYVFIALWLVYLLFHPQTRKTGLALLLLIATACTIAINTIPTLRERIGYFKWTMMVFQEGQRNGLYSDMGRVMSYDIALRLIKEKPLLGTGAGNLLDTMKDRYEKWYPEVADEQRLIPHNMVLNVGVACGIPAMLVFVAWLLYPLTKIKRNRNGFFFFIVWLVMLIPLMVEPVLEVQYGVFVVLFFINWQSRFLEDERAKLL